MEGYSSEVGSDEKNVLVQFWKSVAVEKCNSALLWNWLKIRVPIICQGIPGRG